ncbi:hypothetical protein SUNI508_09206 [Seiridium unicorne]|uniref:Uncharacterized protein n=1 Tax=Seiridium unicorne TaxID=138068 RepID=A0ABR2UR02_9PEZI
MKLPERCPNSFSYHYRYDPASWEAMHNETCPPFEHGVNEDVWFVALRWDLFCIGSEAADLEQRIIGLLNDLSNTQNAQEQPSSLASLEKSLEIAQKQFRSTTLYLAQLAKTWDLNHDKGLCPNRPGRSSDPNGLLMLSEDRGERFLEFSPSVFLAPDKGAAKWPDPVQITAHGVPSVAAIWAERSGYRIAPGTVMSHYPPRLTYIGPPVRRPGYTAHYASS